LKPDVTVSSKSNMPKLAAALKKLQKAAVYIGIPAENSLRTDGEITNAQLLYLQSHGSPLQNIPAMPVIETAIEAPENIALISAELKQAAKSIMDGKPEEAHQHLEKAGQLGENSAKGFFTESLNRLAPDAPSPIEDIRKALTHVVAD